VPEAMKRRREMGGAPVGGDGRAGRFGVGGMACQRAVARAQSSSK